MAQAVLVVANISFGASINTSGASGSTGSNGGNVNITAYQGGAITTTSINAGGTGTGNNGSVQIFTTGGR